MTETNYPWIKGDGLIDMEYVNNMLKEKSPAELPYNRTPDEIILAEHTSLCLQENGFAVREREEDKTMTLIVSKLEEGVI